MEAEEDRLEHHNTRMHRISQVTSFETKALSSVEALCVSINGQVKLVSDFGHFHQAIFKVSQRVRLLLVCAVDCGKVQVSRLAIGLRLWQKISTKAM